MVTYLVNRAELVLEVEEIKRHAGECISREDVERDRVANLMEIGEKVSLSSSFVGTIMYAIIGESCKKQMQQRDIGTSAMFCYRLIGKARMGCNAAYLVQRRLPRIVVGHYPEL